jgi:hypothetical protein
MINTEIKGLEDAKKGTVFEIIGSILVSSGLVILILTGEVNALLNNINNEIIASSISAGVVIIVGLIVNFVGLLYLYKGFKTLNYYGRDTGIGSTGIILFLIGIVMAILGFASALVFPLGILLAIAGVFMIIIGNILIGIGYYNLGSGFRDSNIKTGGILYLLGPFIFSLLSFIGLILVYIGLSHVIRNYVQTGGLAYQTPSVSQVGIGVLRNDNTAVFQLYSNFPAVILYVRIGNNYANSISPTTLPSNTIIVITVTFPIPLPYSQMYIASVGVNVGGQFKEIPVYLQRL